MSRIFVIFKNIFTCQISYKLPKYPFTDSAIFASKRCVVKPSAKSSSLAKGKGRDGFVSSS